MGQSDSLSSGASPTRVNEATGYGAGISPKRYTNMQAGTPVDGRVTHDGQPKGSAGSKSNLGMVQGGKATISPSKKPWDLSGGA